MLTKKQKRVLDYIKTYREKNGYSPSLEEIRKRARVASVSTAHYYVTKLHKAGYLEKENNHPRGIELFEEQKQPTTEIMMLGTIAAGQPITAFHAPFPVNIPADLITGMGNYYALRVQGESMIEEGIFDGDTVVVREQQDVNTGETAVVYLPDRDEVTLKKVFPEDGWVRLQPANRHLAPIFERTTAIQGKVIGVLRKVI